MAFNSCPLAHDNTAWKGLGRWRRGARGCANKRTQRRREKGRLLGAVERDSFLSFTAKHAFFVIQEG